MYEERIECSLVELYLFSDLQKLLDIGWPHVIRVGLDGEPKTLPTVYIHLT